MGTSVFAQVPNGSFETWNKETIDVLKGWNSQGKHEKVAGPNSDDAVKISTDADGNLGVVAYVDFSDDLSNLKGGFAYSGKPIKLKANLRYNIPAGDTAAIIISASVQGQTISLDLHRITGSQSSFADQEFAITYFAPLIPDSIVLGITSGNIDGDPIPGGWIEVSKVEFLNNNGSTMTAIPNGDFSQWEAKTLETLEGWNTSTDLLRAFGSDLETVTKDVIATSGDFALKLESLVIQEDTFPGIAFTVKNKNDFEVEGPTFKVTEKHLSLQGKYKYKPVGNDSFTVNAVLYFQGSIIASGQFKSGETVDTFKSFFTDITYSAPLTPDSATIAIFNTNPDRPGAPGTTLWIDELSMKEWTTGIKEINSNFTIYPNPAKNYTTIKGIDGSLFNVEVINVSGQVVESYHKIKSKLILNTSNYNSGVYFVRIESNRQTTTKKIIVK